MHFANFAHITGLTSNCMGLKGDMLNNSALLWPGQEFYLGRSYSYLLHFYCGFISIFCTKVLNLAEICTAIILFEDLL